MKVLRSEQTLIDYYARQGLSRAVYRRAERIPFGTRFLTTSL